MKRQRFRSWLLLFLLLVLLALLGSLILSIARNTHYGSLGTTDFIEYWSAGQLLLRGENPYDFESLFEVEKTVGWPHSTPLVMWNPPWALAWLYPLLLLDFETASLAWLGINFGIVLLSSTLVWSVCAVPPWRSRRLVAWPAGFFFAPALMTLGLGQISGLNLLGIVLFVWLSGTRRFFAAGMALALITVKIHILYLVWPFLLWWVVKNRHWRVPAGFASVLLPSMGVLTVFRYGWPADYVQALRGPPLYWATPTLGGISREFLGVSWPQVQYVPSLLMLLAALVYLAWRRPVIDWPKWIGPLLLVSVATAAFGWSYDQVVLLVPFLEVVVVTVQRPEFRIGDRVLLWSGLASYSVFLFAMNLMQVDELHKFWLVWILGLTYWLARRRER